MRRHSLLERYAPFIEPARFARVASAQHLLAARLQPLLFQRGQSWYGVIAPSDITQPQRFAVESAIVTVTNWVCPGT